MLHSFMRATALAGASVVLAASASAQETQRWRLDFEADKPQSITIENAQGHSDSYWYLTYKVTNGSGAERPLSLGFQLITDLKDPKKLDQPLIYRAQTVAKVEKAIERRLGKDLVGIGELAGATIGDGDTVEGIVVFGKVDPNVDDFKVEVRGLVDPLSREGSRAFVERKVMWIHYERKGDEFFVSLDPLKRRKVEWKVLARDEVRLPKKYDGR